jgi:ribosome-binding factor A
MATHTRIDRVAALIQQEIGNMLTRGLKDPRIGFVTITGAKASPDLREAWIYYAVHGDERARQETAKGLEAARGYIRRELGKAMSIRVTPELHFVVDEAIDRGDRIEQLLKQVHDEDEKREQPAPAKGEETT